ncbi:MAG: X-Pro dipeptidyl-peptidase, partial [Nitrospirae bacterium]|nr:X-Pro dipeptidyl-peptidase [Fimbriimonadaceae bacterium]
VDVQPEGTKDPDGNDIGGAQMMVRGEIMRSKFRQSYSNPAPLTPGKREVVEFTLPDVFHTFKKGHRIMVQVQSAWFPLADRNPQTFTDIYSAGQDAFVKATIQMHRGANGSRIEVGTR